MQEALVSGRLKSLPERLYGAYNNYSQRKVLEEEAPKVLEFCREDDIDVAILVPVCHQTVDLIARHLESAGMPTAIMATARDIIEHCGVARLLFFDFPLGNPCGEPYNIERQRALFE